MERSFLIKKESKYYKDYEEYISKSKTQRDLVTRFLEKNNIETRKFCVSGDGMCNSPFHEECMKDIRLLLIPTEEDVKLYQNQFTRIDDDGVCRLRATSKLSKIFQRYCIDNQIIINILKPDLRDYLKSMDWMGYITSMIPCDKGYYLKVLNDLLKEDDIPEGFEVIKTSEFYKYREEYENKNN